MTNLCRNAGYISSTTFGVPRLCSVTSGLSGARNGVFNNFLEVSGGVLQKGRQGCFGLKPVNYLSVADKDNSSSLGYKLSAFHKVSLFSPFPCSVGRALLRSEQPVRLRVSCCSSERESRELLTFEETQGTSRQEEEILKRQERYEECVEDHIPLPRRFSNLPESCPWGWDEVVSLMLVYEFLLHIPLGLGGPSIAVALFGQEFMSPPMLANILAFSGTAELLGAVLLLRSSLAAYGPRDSRWFHADLRILGGPRGLLLAVPVGVIVTVGASIASRVALEMFVSWQGTGVDTASQTGMMSAESLFTQGPAIFTFLFLAPCLEELVYRSFLLASMVQKMPLLLAVGLSSGVFAIAHPSVSTWVELWSIGCVLGCTYAWTGNLCASIIVHGVYNALVLLAESQSMH